jgi:endonuclease/exonuclease/phosphatase family metal-dependent hydrolase
MKHLKQFISFSLLVLTISHHAMAQPLTFASWNLQWLTSTPVAQQPDSYRTTRDIRALRKMFNTMNVDILAFQEVNDMSIVRRVVGKEYAIVLSDRSLPQYRAKQFKQINQYTGFAIRKSVPFNDNADIELTPHSKLRFASSIQLKRRDGSVLSILSVHLKSGCIGKFYPKYSSCKKLAQQGQALNHWIKQQQRLKQDYLILGDFNHNLAHDGDWLWEVINLKLSQPVILATRDVQAKCRVKPHRDSKKMVTYTKLVDHIISSTGVKFTSPILNNFDRVDPSKYRLSDHCPILLTTEQ